MPFALSVPAGRSSDERHSYQFDLANTALTFDAAERGTTPRGKPLARNAVDCCTSGALRCHDQSAENDCLMGLTSSKQFS